ncbi:hypothetical protein QZN01_20855 [Burkholderia cenocepacia]|uniref:hypothetical protein n=1 Tax=Burkholderia cenocepacia TaxID=95486 RepID=UPI00264E7DCC|nr:hypothetical protein [Burkholderia cenocepacia]MDN7825105.1 hypothetical protein [Burkholderia cenocepacia]
MTEPAEKPDWERIEAEYRAGVLSLREIAKLHPGVSHVSIKRRADKEGWTRDLAEKIQAKAEDLVTKQAVTPEVTAKRAVTEREVIDANAARIAQVRGEHRVDISRARALAMTLLAEVEAETGSLDHLRELGELLFNPDERGRDRLNETYMKIISSAGRIDSMKRLAETLRHLIALEREAYGLKDAEKPGSGMVGVPVTPADERL